MKILIILNDPPYGTERSYNRLRLANNLLVSAQGSDVTLFLMADAVFCAKAGQSAPDGYYNMERMLKPIVRLYNLIVVNERVRLGDAPFAVDRYFENIIKGAPLRSKRKRLAGVCLFVMITIVMLGLQVYSRFGLPVFAILLLLAAIFSWRVYRSPLRLGWF